MKKILISVNPTHVKNIINGTKKFEYRTRVAKLTIDSVIIYSTFPTMRVVAEVEIKGILEFSPEELWNLTKEYSGIDKVFLMIILLAEQKHMLIN
jgi:predicted transcriptional regulator